MSLFGRDQAPPDSKTPRVESTSVVTLADMAIDTLGSVLRTLSEYPLDQEEMDAKSFADLAEQWAQHVLMAATAPSAKKADIAPLHNEPRRDWTGVREFVRGYCRGSSVHTRTVIGDLRQVVWVFIQSLSHAFEHDRDADTKLIEQLARLERLAQGSETGDLKKEVLATVVEVSQALDDRRRRQREQMETLGNQVKTLGHELESVKRESETDPLTKLYNRKAFDDHLNKTLQLYRAFGQTSSLLIMDVDRFKVVNDTMGHVTGDELLRKVADSISRVFLRKTDFVARYGGDEIAVVLHDTKAHEAAPLAERVLRGVRTISIQKDDVNFSPSITIGIAQLHPGFDEKAWVESADQALLRAKQAGRDRVEVTLPASPAHNPG